MEEKIVLDQKSFEALAADSRVAMLKSLKERRKTLSELSKEMKLSVSGTKEHLDTLKKAGLIQKIDDGHKWKYYELTKKGKDIVGPKEIRVWILLSISSVALALSIFSLLSLGIAETPMMQASAEDTLLYEVSSTPESGLMVSAAAIDEQSGGGSSEVSLVRENAESNKEPDSDLTNSADGILVAAIEKSAPGELHYESVGSAKEPPLITFLISGISAITIISCIAILVRNRAS